MSKKRKANHTPKKNPTAKTASFGKLKQAGSNVHE
jgi:hypothetical protein